MKLVIAGLVMSTISLVTNIIGIVLPYWAYASNDGVSYASNSGATATRGLWHRCDTRDDMESIDCFEAYTTVPAYIHAIRALEIIGTILVAVSTGCGALKVFVRKDDDELPKYAAGFGLSAGVLMLISISLFAINFVDSSDTIPEFHYNLSAGFVLCTSSGVLSMTAGTVFLIEYLRNRIWYR